MRKRTIALDIDDVLSHSAAGIISYSNKRWGHNHTLEDFNEHLAEMWQVDHDEVERRWVEYMASGTMEQYRLMDGAQAVLRKLKKRYHIVAVTSRREVLSEMTKWWLQANYPDLVESVILANFYGSGAKHPHKMTKAAILQEIGAHYLVDDQPKHCNGAAAVGVQAVLFGDYAWNRSAELADGVVRCKDWQAVQEYFDEQNH
jgi:5'(3')-deoxyribonucleotidase